MNKVSDYKLLKLLLSTIFKIDWLLIPVLVLKTLVKVLDLFINIAIPMFFIRGYEGGFSRGEFLKILVLLGLSKIILKSLSSILEREEKIRYSILNQKFPQVLSRVSMDLSYEKLEDPNILDLKERALFPITNYGALNILLEGLTSFTTAFFTLFGSITILFSFSWLAVLVPLLLSLLITYILGKFSAYNAQFSQSLIPINRRYGYYSSLMLQNTYQKEIRIFQMQTMIRQRAESYINKVFDEFDDFFMNRGKIDSLVSLFQILIRLFIYSFGALRVINSDFGPEISLAFFTLVIGANENFMSSFQNFIMAIFSLKMSVGHLRPFGEFLNLEKEEKRGQEPIFKEFESLEFENVSFSYPNTDRKILDSISFTIKRGEKISIVGLNNSGKTTIVKLICRFFSPSSGQIKINGINIEDYEKEAYMEALSCVFQDFSIFPLSIKDNILGGQDYNEKRLEKIILDLGLNNRIAGLKSGLDTMLNKSIYEDATDFSGGERQKLAIGRCLYKGGRLVILDEPTAALDPLAESEIFEDFNNLTRGKTTIFISHRMSSTKFSDKVLLIDKGRVQDFDSHKNLMKNNKLYKDLYQAQAQYFFDGNN